MHLFLKRTFPIALVLLVFIAAEAFITFQRSQDMTTARLTHIARNHIGNWVPLGEFHIAFEAASSSFEAEGPFLRIKTSGTYSDLRKYVKTKIESDTIEMKLDLLYQIDVRKLDSERGITTADTKEIIEIHCEHFHGGLPPENCIRLKVIQDGKKVAIPAGMEAGVLAGFGRARDELAQTKSGNLITAMCSMINQLRTASGFESVCG